MTGADMVQAAVLGVLAAIGVMCVALGVLSRLGLLDRNGWVFRDERRCPAQRFTGAELAAVRDRRRATERWLDARENTRAAAVSTFREPSLPELVDRANRLPTLCLLVHVPVSPDPRHKEN